VFEIFNVRASGFTYAVWQLLFFISVHVQHTDDDHKSDRNI